MKEEMFQIRSLTYTNMGAVDSYRQEFTPGVQLLTEENAEITACVLRRVLGDRYACQICMHPNSRIVVQLQIGQEQRKIYINHIGSSADIPVDVFPYLQEVTRTQEEQELYLFVKEEGYRCRLQQYWEYPEDFVERTVDSPGAPILSTTKTFRYYLRRFIRTFRPERLLPDKDLWLQLEKNGQFSVTQGRKGEKVPHLSETDNWVFAYLCFLHLRRFWDGVRKRCRYPASVLPVVIRDFSDRLDESVDYETLLRRAETVSSQIIVLKE